VLWFASLGTTGSTSLCCGLHPSAPAAGLSLRGGLALDESER